MRKLRRSRGKACAFAPDTPYYANVANYTLALQSFDEALQIIHDAPARKLDEVVLRNALYTLAFLGADSTAMAEQQPWFAGKPDYESFGLAPASDTEAYGVILARRGN